MSSSPVRRKIGLRDLRIPCDLRVKFSFWTDAAAPNGFVLRFSRISFLMQPICETVKALLLLPASLLLLALLHRSDRDPATKSKSSTPLCSPRRSRRTCTSSPTKLAAVFPARPPCNTPCEWGVQAFTAAGRRQRAHRRLRPSRTRGPRAIREMTAVTAYQVDPAKVGGGFVLSGFRVRAVSVAWAPARLR